MAQITLDEIFGNEETGPYEVHHGIFVDRDKPEARCKGPLGIRIDGREPVLLKKPKAELLKLAGLCCLACNVSITIVTPKPTAVIA